MVQCLEPIHGHWWEHMVIHMYIYLANIWWYIFQFSDVASLANLPRGISIKWWLGFKTCLNWKKTSLKNGIKLKLESKSAEKLLEQFFYPKNWWFIFHFNEKCWFGPMQIPWGNAWQQNGHFMDDPMPWTLLVCPQTSERNKVCFFSFVR
jgi:hypothetical protein